MLRSQQHKAKQNRVHILWDILYHIDRIMQRKCSSDVSVMELPFFCMKPSTFIYTWQYPETRKRYTLLKMNWAHVTNACSIIICIRWKIYFAVIPLRAIRSNFCTCHDSATAVSHAKIGRDHLNATGMKAKRNFYRISLEFGQHESLLMKWTHGGHCWHSMH